MDAFPQTSIERTYNPSLQLEGIDQQLGPETNTVPENEIAGQVSPSAAPISVEPAAQTVATASGRSARSGEVAPGPRRCTPHLMAELLQPLRVRASAFPGRLRASAGSSAGQPDLASHTLVAQG